MVIHIEPFKEQIYIIGYIVCISILSSFVENQTSQWFEHRLLLDKQMPYLLRHIPIWMSKSCNLDLEINQILHFQLEPNPVSNELEQSISGLDRVGDF